MGDIGEASARPGLPPGLKVRERAPSAGWDDYRGPVVVFAHGSLDRGASFGRTALRLPDLALVTYDRRGYRASRDLGAAPLPAHVEDLVRIADVYAEAVPGASGERPPQVVAVGHSVGATLVLWAGVVVPERFSALAAYEPSMPWLGFHPPAAPPTAPPPTAPPDGAGGSTGTPAGAGAATDPAAEAERFFRRMVGDAAWERLGDQERRSRQADGPALLADLRGIRMPTPFDVTALRVPTVVAAGGSASRPHHRKTVAWLGEHVAAVETVEVGQAGHGAHLSHPDAFAELVRRAVALGAAQHAG